MNKINYQSIINIINNLAGIEILELKIESEEITLRHFHREFKIKYNPKFLNNFLFKVYKNYKRHSKEWNLDFIKKYEKRFYYSYIKGQEYFNTHLERI